MISSSNNCLPAADTMIVDPATGLPVLTDEYEGDIEDIIKPDEVSPSDWKIIAAASFAAGCASAMVFFLAGMNYAS